MSGSLASSLDGVLRKMPPQLRLRFIARWRRMQKHSKRGTAAGKVVQP